MIPGECHSGSLLRGQLFSSLFFDMSFVGMFVFSPTAFLLGVLICTGGRGPVFGARILAVKRRCHAAVKRPFIGKGGGPRQCQSVSRLCAKVAPQSRALSFKSAPVWGACNVRYLPDFSRESGVQPIFDSCDMALEFIFGADFWCNRTCKPGPVDLEWFWGQVWPKTGQTCGFHFWIFGPVGVSAGLIS